MPDDVEAQNIAVYERVFEKCLKAADRLIKEKGFSEGTERRAACLQVATTVFKRFYDDQSAIQGAERQAKAMISSMASVLESRGGGS